ncbi:MAG: hypothetical protein R2851_27570 [Caldilineaceae bacterium]
MAFNNANSAQQATFAVYTPNTQFTRLYGAGVAGTITSDGNSQLTVGRPPPASSSTRPRPPA